MLNAHRFKAFAFIALWQTAPVVVEQDTAGRVIIHFAGAAGRYESISTSCEGDVTGTETKAYRAAALGVEAWPADWARVGAFGTWAGGDDAEFAGLSFGALAAAEARWVGVGLGFDRKSGRDVTLATDDSTWGTHTFSAQTIPVVYLRAGDIDRLHLRIESSGDDGIGGMLGVIRVGPAWNHGRLRGPRWFGGVAMCQAECDDAETNVAFFDVAFPVGRHFDMRAGAVVGPGEESAEFGLVLGGSFSP